MCLKTALSALVAVVCLAAPSIAGSNSPTIPVQTRAALGALSDADSRSPQYQHVYVPEKGYAALYDYDTTSTASCPSAGYVAPDSSYICTTPVVSAGRWVRSDSANAVVGSVAQLAAMPGSWFAVHPEVYVQQHHSGYPYGAGSYTYLTPIQATGLIPDAVYNSTYIGLVVAPSDAPTTCATYGCYVRNVSGELSADKFGCVEDFSADDQPCIQAMLHAGASFRLNATSSAPTPSILSYDLSRPGGSIRINSPVTVDPKAFGDNAANIYLTTNSANVAVCTTTTGFDLLTGGWGSNSSGFKSVIFDGKGSQVYGDCGSGQSFIRMTDAFGYKVENFHGQKFGSGGAFILNQTDSAGAANRYAERNIFDNIYVEKSDYCYRSISGSLNQDSFDDTVISNFRCNISAQGNDAKGFWLQGYYGRSAFDHITCWRNPSSTNYCYYLDGNMENSVAHAIAVDAGSDTNYDIGFGPNYGCANKDCDQSYNLTVYLGSDILSASPASLALPPGWSYKLNVLGISSSFGALVNQQGYSQNIGVPSGRYRVSAPANLMQHTYQIAWGSGAGGAVQRQDLTLYGTSGPLLSGSCIMVPNGSLGSSGQTDDNVILDNGSCGIYKLYSPGNGTLVVGLYRIIGPNGRASGSYVSFTTGREASPP